MSRALSLSEQDYDLANASLFEIDVSTRVWKPSETLNRIRKYIEAWNEYHLDPSDKIIGVVMDSATSMAGFDSMDAQATTNFFFYLGRMCESLNIFWSIIGHVPKTSAIGRNWRETAPSRLRGVAMWTTAPRLTVEVRLIQEWGARRARRKSDDSSSFENQTLRDAYRDRSRQDFLVVYVAKANLLGKREEPAYLLRSARGAFTDVTAEGYTFSGAPAGCQSHSGPNPAPATLAEPTAKIPDEKRRRTVGRAPKVDADYIPGTDQVWELIRLTYPAMEHGCQVVADHLQRKIKEVRHAGDESAYDLVLTASTVPGGEPRRGSIKWHLVRLVERGLLIRNGVKFRLATAPPDNASALV